MGERKAASRTWRSERERAVDDDRHLVRPSRLSEYTYCDRKRRYCAAQTDQMKETDADGIDFTADFQSQYV